MRDPTPASPLKGREYLPNRRHGEVLKLHDGVLDYAVGITCYEDGRPAEVFISSSKPTSHLDDIARDAAIMASIRLQYGAPVEVLRGAATRAADGSGASIIGIALDVMAGEPPPGESDIPSPAPSGPLLPRGEGSAVQAEVGS